MRASSKIFLPFASSEAIQKVDALSQSPQRGFLLTEAEAQTLIIQAFRSNVAGMRDSLRKNHQGYTSLDSPEELAKKLGLEYDPENNSMYLSNGNGKRIYVGYSVCLSIGTLAGFDWEEIPEDLQEDLETLRFLIEDYMVPIT